MICHFAVVPTVVGPLWVAQSARGICRSLLGVDEEGFLERCSRELLTELEQDPSGSLAAVAAARLEEDVALAFDLERCTPFQRAVLEVVAEIPRGEVRTYAEVATVSGRPGAARAVGQALRANPIPVLIPCHRVVGSDGSLGGYTPDLTFKARLLASEGAFL